MCKWGIQATQVKLANPKSDGRTHAPVDPCIAHLVQAFNDAGIQTVASCCGHNNTFGRISLEDGTDIVIMPFQEAQNYFRSRANGNRKQDEMEKTIADLIRACQLAEEWLNGWASAEPYLSDIISAIEKATK